jgi:hypothetical protein
MRDYLILSSLQSLIDRYHQACIRSQIRYDFTFNRLKPEIEIRRLEQLGHLNKFQQYRLSYLKLMIEGKTYSILDYESEYQSMRSMVAKLHIAKNLLKMYNSGDDSITYNKVHEALPDPILYD